MDNNNIIIMIIAFIAIYYFFFYNKETMANVLFKQQKFINNLTNKNPEQKEFINNLYNYINTSPDNSTLTDYINFLTNNKNTNLHIIDNEVFVTFKMLKKRNMFTPDDIALAMKL